MNEKNRMEEEWRTVVGFEDYEVSSLGRVRSLKSGKVEYRKCQKNKYGYIRVGLWNNGKMKNCQVHRLVYTSFVGDIDDGLQIDHIDGDKSNNKLTNLRAVSPKVNSNNPVTRVRYLEAMKKTLLSEKWRNNQREGIRRRRSESEEWRNNQREAAKKLVKNPQWVHNHREGIKRRSKNREWFNNFREGVRRVCAKPVIQLDVKTGEEIRRWECGSDAARELKISAGSISGCCHGKNKSAGGYRWRFA